MCKIGQVGVLTSHVHSIVMSSNGMEGRIPPSINQLRYLRMIELATMPGMHIKKRTIMAFCLMFIFACNPVCVANRISGYNSS